MSQESQEYKFELDLTFEMSDNLDLTLGITDERSDELLEFIKSSISNNDYVTNALNDITKICKSNNEVAYALCLAGKIYQRYNSIQTQ
jgi:hypothetical protein